MKSKAKIRIGFIIIGMIFILTAIEISNDADGKINEEKNNDNNNLTPLESWYNNNQNPIHIDEDTSQDWAWARTQLWCQKGDGSFGDPYVIENVSIDCGGSGSGIFIENSKNVNFTIQNCTVFNADSGIRLENTDDGNITANYCYSNDIGIHLINTCENNTIFNNTAYSNADSGITLEINCNYNNITENNAYSNGNTLDGQIYLRNNCHNNKISNNSIYATGFNMGIKLESNCAVNTISENIINGGMFTISIYLLHGSDGNIVHKNNIASSSIVAFGMLIDNAQDNVLTNNSIYAALVGIVLQAGSHDIFIENNTIEAFSDGIKIQNSHDIVISGNQIEAGIKLEGGSYLNFGSHKIYSNNTISGRKIYYYVEKEELNGNNFTNAGQIMLIRCNNSIISNLELSGSSFSQVSYRIFLYDCEYNQIIGNNASHSGNGIYLDTNCNHNNIVGNNASYSYYGLYLDENCDYNNISGNIANNNIDNGIRLNHNCDHNNITGNTVNDNMDSGIYLGANCDYNNISGNTANNNEYCGMYLGINCNYNIITKNTINNNGYYTTENPDNFYGGICISNSINNFIWNNTFIGNSVNANDTRTNNYWNSTIMGNYWEDYSGVDENDDGIGDTPYIISGGAGNRDYLPIWEDEDDPPQIYIQDPDDMQPFGTNSPEFILLIDHVGLDQKWYALYNGTEWSKNYTCDLIGKINQTAWEAMPEGLIIFRFYANDSTGNVGYTDITVIKDTSTPPNGGDGGGGGGGDGSGGGDGDEAIPGYDFYLINAVIGIITIFMIYKYKTRINTQKREKV
ncbi:MAG: NosD domain-containing protein [Candidatus Hermodarchaeota archaeon]